MAVARDERGERHERQETHVGLRHHPKAVAAAKSSELEPGARDGLRPHLARGGLSYQKETWCWKALLEQCRSHSGVRQWRCQWRCVAAAPALPEGRRGHRRCPGGRGSPSAPRRRRRRARRAPRRAQGSQSGERAAAGVAGSAQFLGAARGARGPWRPPRRLEHRAERPARARQRILARREAQLPRRQRALGFSTVCEGGGGRRAVDGRDGLGHEGQRARARGLEVAGASSQLTAAGRGGSGGRGAGQADL